LPRVTALSNWIADQVDIRGWAHALGVENRDNIVKTGHGANILLLLTPPSNAPQEVKSAYWNWVEERLLVPIKEQDTELYAWIVDWQRRMIVEFADTDLSEKEKT
jgi:hypothetical protein